MNSDLYDYEKLFTQRIVKIARSIQDGLDLYLTINRDEGDEIAPLVNKDITRDMVLPLINPGIIKGIGRNQGSEYESLLMHWANAIKVLEEKKYPREQILSIMYENAATHWWSVARSMPISG